MRFRSRVLLIAALSVLSACSLERGGATTVEAPELGIVFPDRQGLAELSDDARSQLRVLFSVPGVLAPSPLQIDPVTGRLTGSFVVPDSVAGQDLEGKIECYGRENFQSDEVLLFRGTTSFAASSGLCC